MKKRITALIIALTMTNVIALNTYEVAYAVNKDENKNKIEENKGKINDLKDKKNDIAKDKAKENSKLEEIMGEIEKKSDELTRSEGVVNRYEGEIALLDSNIAELQKNVDDINNNIKIKEEEISKNEKEAVERENILSERLRSYYKMDINSQFLYMIFSSKSIGDLISTIFNINKIVDTDNALLKEIEEVHNKLDEEKQKLSENKNKVNEEIEKIEVQKNEQVKLKEKADEERRKYQSEMDSLKALEKEKEDTLKAMSDKEKALQDEIGDLTSYNERLQAEIDSIFENINNGSEVNNSVSKGGFIKPVNAPITSPYGPRMHPIKGQVGFHTGTDFGAAMNTPIKAAKSGKVVHAGWMGGYGKAVIIDHGNGEQTLYAHTNSYNVSVGQTVKQGDIIAKVGSTGMSTGPHLHLEVRINGKHTNAMNYIK